MDRSRMFDGKEVVSTKVHSSYLSMLCTVLYRVDIELKMRLK